MRTRRPTWQPADMDIGSMPLRRRILLVFTAGITLVLVVAIAVGVQYAVSTSSAQRLQDRLTPATELADALLTAQFAASADLTDYVLTGRERFLDSHAAALQQATSTLGSLDVTVDADEKLLAELALVSTAQALWVANDVEPTLRLMADGRTSEAVRATTRPRASAAFDAMIAATTEFGDMLESQRDAARTSSNAFTRQIGFWLIVLATVLLGALAAVLIAANRWIVNPLSAIRRDIADATGGTHTHPITPSGPPELAAVATDAENLRRSLVAEIDEARAARTGLTQAAPLAAELQQAFTPSAIPAIPGLSLAGTTSTAEGVVSGDWWDLIPLGSDRLGLVVGDTSGHGTSATLTALRTRDILRAALRNGSSPQGAIELAASAFDEDRNFVTVFIAIIDAASSSLTFVNAGHQPPVLITAAKDTQHLGRTGPLLSALGGDWIDQIRAFDIGDVLLAYTDGLIEGQGPDGNDLAADDLARIIKALDAPVRRDASEVLARVIAQIRERASNWHRDDMTAVTVGHVGMAL